MFSCAVSLIKTTINYCYWQFDCKLLAVNCFLQEIYTKYFEWGSTWLRLRLNLTETEPKMSHHYCQIFFMFGIFPISYQQQRLWWWLHNYVFNPVHSVTRQQWLFSFSLLTPNKKILLFNTKDLRLNNETFQILDKHVHWVLLTTSKKMYEKLLAISGCLLWLNFFTLLSVMLMQRNMLVVAGCSLQPNSLVVSRTQCMSILYTEPVIPSQLDRHSLHWLCEDCTVI